MGYNGSLDNLIAIFRELYRVCCDGALVEIRAVSPHYALQSGDPLIVRSVRAETLNFFSRTGRKRLSSDERYTETLNACEGIDFQVLKTELSFNTAFRKYIAAKNINHPEQILTELNAHQDQLLSSTFYLVCHKPGDPAVADTLEPEHSFVLVKNEELAALRQLMSSADKVQSVTDTSADMIHDSAADGNGSGVTGAGAGSDAGAGAGDGTAVAADAEAKAGTDEKAQGSVSGVMPGRKPFVLRTAFFREQDHAFLYRSIANTGAWELSESKLFCKMLFLFAHKYEQFNFANIGASIGWYSLLAASMTAKVKVDAFEPTPLTVEILKQNIRLNQLQEQIKVHAVALSDQEGESSFFLNPDNDSNNSLCNSAVGDNIILDNTGHQVELKEIKVKTDTLDHIYLSQDKSTWPHFILIDTEGHEQYVFDGAHQLFEQGFRPIITAEFHPSLFSLRERKTTYYKDLVAKYGYRIYIIPGNGSLALTDVDYLDKASTELMSTDISNASFLNIMLVPDHIIETEGGFAFKY